MRAPFQVIIFPYRCSHGWLQVLIGKRADDGHWQAISGGGEDDETPLQAAARELFEEAGMTGENWQQLDSCCMLPKTLYKDHTHWGDDVFVIPEYAFAVAVSGEVVLSDEHSELTWLDVDAATQLLQYDSNKTALWELSQRLAL